MVISLPSVSALVTMVSKYRLTSGLSRRPEWYKTQVMKPSIAQVSMAIFQRDSWR